MQLPQPRTPGFYVAGTRRHIETISALQMLNLENIAHNELGLAEDMSTENAARGIAEVALLALDDPAIKVRLPNASLTSGNTVVVIMAGNNKAGARAVAAG